MNTPRAEKAIQLIAIPAIWLAFATVWLAAPGYVGMHEGLGLACTSLSALWFAVAQSGLSFLVPGALTCTIAWLMRVRSRHATWTAAAVLGFGLLYVIGAHIAAVLPAYSMCRKV